MSVYEKWRAWQKRCQVKGLKYVVLFARLSRSPAADKLWKGR